jgi:hypothetical protein
LYCIHRRYAPETLLTLMGLKLVLTASSLGSGLVDGTHTRTT